MSGLYENPKSASERLLDALVFGFKEITQASGYSNTIKDVFTEIPTPSQLVNHPSMALIMGRELTDWDDTEAMVNTLPVTLMVFIKEASNPTAARLTLKKDIQRRLGVNWMVPGEDDQPACSVVKPTAYEPFGMFLNVPHVGFIMEIQIEYSQDVNDPTVST